MFQDEMEFKKDDKILWLIKKDIKIINHENEIMVVSPVQGDTGKLRYFFLLSSGKFSLYAKKSIVFRPFEPPKPYGERKPERFENVPDEYYMKTEKMPARIIKNKKTLISLLSDNKDAQNFIKNEKVRADDPEDLKKLFDFLNNK